MINESLAALALLVIVVAYNRQRELPRTLYSLSRSCQRGIDALRYEVLVVDNGSEDPVASGMAGAFGPEFRLLRVPSGNPSPVDALNQAAAASRGASLMLCVDGARILSPAGGYANLDFFERMCESQGATLILLLGKGSFHQLLLDPSEMSIRSSQRMQLYAREYRELRGGDFHAPTVDALHLGRMPDEALRFVSGYARMP